jgi:hypothetical protein
MFSRLTSRSSVNFFNKFTIFSVLIILSACSNDNASSSSPLEQDTVHTKGTGNGAGSDPTTTPTTDDTNNPSSTSGNDTEGTDSTLDSASDDTASPPDEETDTTPSTEEIEGTDTDDSDTSSDTEDVVSISVERLCEVECLDFPEDPIIEGEIPETALASFKTNETFEGPGPCVIEPQLSDGVNPGAIFPVNWLRPRFHFTPTSDDADVYEIRLSADRQKYDMVVYTTETIWIMPEEIWKGLAASAIDEPITVTIREIESVNPDMPKGTSGTFSIAPIRAGGKLVYWATTSANVNPDTSKLVGFAVGDEGVMDALTIDQVGDRDLLSADGRQERSPAYGVGEGCVQCIGCHVATPDGEAVAFGDHWPWNVVVASVRDPATTTVDLGKAPIYLTESAEVLLNQPWLGMPTFSKAQWNDNTKLLVTSYGERLTESGDTVGFTNSSPAMDVLAWFDLQTDVNMVISDDYQGDPLFERNRLVTEALGTGFGFLSLTGETLSAVSPDWSHDGTRIAYTAASVTMDGRLGGGQEQTDVDIHIVPFNEGRGGTVVALQGGCDKDAAEYYPAFSPDDELIVFNREDDFRAQKTVYTKHQIPYNRIDINGAVDPIYYRPHAELYVVPSQGGTPMRLIANDPPTCTDETSPGIVNSWGKWAPDVKMSSETFGPKRSFYWVIFSSARYYPEQFIIETNPYSPKDNRSSQLYMAAIVRNEETGEYTDYPAVYLWNQDKNTSNLTPAWDNFKIPVASANSK